MNERQEQKQSELLAGWVLGDLTHQERDEVSTLLADQSNQQLLHQLESTAAAAQIAMQMTYEDLPRELSTSIRRKGVDMVQERSLDSAASAWVGGVASAPRDFAAETTKVLPASQHTAGTGREWFAWAVAIAALFLAVVMWQGNDPPSEQGSPLSMVEQRSELLAKAGVTQVSWGPGSMELDDEVSGDVVWDPASQSGFMTFSGLPVNDPSIEQYQLWIIDPERDDEPVDGGVFDITSAGQSVIAIDAKLAVIKPAAFAITIEKPGGVVVSTQERLPLLAAVK